MEIKLKVENQWLDLIVDNTFESGIKVMIDGQWCNLHTIQSLALHKPTYIYNKTIEADIFYDTNKKVQLAFEKDLTKPSGSKTVIEYNKLSEFNTTKRVVEYKDTIRLKSYNPKYDEIIFDDVNNFSVTNRVMSSKGKIKLKSYNPKHDSIRFNNSNNFETDTKINVTDNGIKLVSQ